MTRAYSYLRFSAAIQSRGDSARRQAEFAARVCEANGWTLDESLTLQDLGVSAFRGKNADEGALREFLDAVKGGRVPKGSVLVIENIDRLSRAKVGIALTQFIELLNRGIVIVTASPERTYTQDSINDIAGLLEPIIGMCRAHEESKTKSMRVRSAWGQKKKRAKDDGVPTSTMISAWIRVKGDKFELIPKHAATVRAIFRMATEGMGSRRIIAELKADPAKYPPFGKSGEWGTSYVEQILRSRSAFGEHQQFAVDPETGEKAAQGSPLVGYYPAAVTEEQFYAARAAVKGRHRKGSGRPSKGELNLFAGLVVEAVERQTMHMRSVTPKSPRGKFRNRYVYLTSKAFSRGESSAGDGRFGRSIDYGAFERAVLSTIRELKASDLADSDGRDALAEMVRAASEAHASFDYKVKEFALRLADPKTPPASLPFYADLLDKAAREKDDARLRLEELAVTFEAGRTDTLGEVQTLAKTLAVAEGQEAAATRRRLRSRLRSLVDEIWVVVERVGYNRRVAHARVYFKNGPSRYVRFYSPARPPRPDDAAPATLGLEDVDLRAFDASAHRSGM